MKTEKLKLGNNVEEYSSKSILYWQDPSTRMLSYVPRSSIYPGGCFLDTPGKRCLGRHLKCVHARPYAQPATQKGIVAGEWMALVTGRIGPKGCGSATYLNRILLN